jgi:hypothetical protein
MLADNLFQEKTESLFGSTGMVTLSPRVDTSKKFGEKFRVNQIGHVLLTNLILSKVELAPHDKFVKISSLVHEIGKTNVDGISNNEGYKLWSVLMNSKFQNVYFSKLSADIRIVESDKNGKVCTLHPAIKKAKFGNGMLVGTILK